MGYAIIMSPCCGCQRLCCHNPPSTVDVLSQPICLEGSLRVNPDERKEIVVLPGVDQPEGSNREPRFRAGASKDWVKMKNPKHPAMTRVKESFA
jgi:hypothetical protein